MTITSEGDGHLPSELVQFLLSKGCTQIYIAERLGAGQAHISRILIKKIQQPRYELMGKLRKLAAEFGCRVK